MKVTPERILWFVTLALAFFIGRFSMLPELADANKQTQAHFDDLIDCQINRSEIAAANLKFMANVIPIIVNSIIYQVPADMAALILKEAEEHNYDPDMIFKMIEVESEFRPNATSAAGAVGLMQVRTIAAQQVGYDVTRSQLRDISTNLHVGLIYLTYLQTVFDGDLRLALLAYNRGPGTVRRYLARQQNPANGYAVRIQGD